VTARFETPPGKQSQVDAGSFKKPGRKRVQGFVMTLDRLRTACLDFSEIQALASFLSCHELAFHYFGGVPEQILYDRTKTVWLRDDDRGERVFHPRLLDFAQPYGYEPRLCRGYRPQTEGKTESGIKYLRRNFWPRIRDYQAALTCTVQRDAGRKRPATCTSKAPPVRGRSTGWRRRTSGGWLGYRLTGPWCGTSASDTRLLLSATPEAGIRRRPNTPGVRSGCARPRLGCSSVTATTGLGHRRYWQLRRWADDLSAGAGRVGR